MCLAFRDHAGGDQVTSAENGGSAVFQEMRYMVFGAFRYIIAMTHQVAVRCEMVAFHAAQKSLLTLVGYQGIRRTVQKSDARMTKFGEMRDREIDALVVVRADVAYMGILWNIVV